MKRVLNTLEKKKNACVYYDAILECPPGFYGIYCSSLCSVNCYVARQCDPSTGHCNNGCTSGWTGNTCEQSNFIFLLSKVVLLYKKGGER